MDKSTLVEILQISHKEQYITAETGKPFDLELIDNTADEILSKWRHPELNFQELNKFVMEYRKYSSFKGDEPLVSAICERFGVKGEFCDLPTALEQTCGQHTHQKFVGWLSVEEIVAMIQGSEIYRQTTSIIPSKDSLRLAQSIHSAMLKAKDIKLPKIENEKHLCAKCRWNFDGKFVGCNFKEGWNACHDAFTKALGRKN